MKKATNVLILAVGFMNIESSGYAFQLDKTELELGTKNTECLIGNPHCSEYRFSVNKVSDSYFSQRSDDSSGLANKSNSQISLNSSNMVQMNEAFTATHLDESQVEKTYSTARVAVDTINFAALKDNRTTTDAIQGDDSISQIGLLQVGGTLSKAVFVPKSKMIQTVQKNEVNQYFLELEDSTGKNIHMMLPYFIRQYKDSTYLELENTHFVPVSGYNLEIFNVPFGETQLHFDRSDYTNLTQVTDTFKVPVISISDSPANPASVTIGHPFRFKVFADPAPSNPLPVRIKLSAGSPNILTTKPPLTNVSDDIGILVIPVTGELSVTVMSENPLSKGNIEFTATLVDDIPIGKNYKVTQDSEDKIKSVMLKDSRMATSAEPRIEVVAPTEVIQAKEANPMVMFTLRTHTKPKATDIDVHYVLSGTGNFIDTTVHNMQKNKIRLSTESTDTNLKIMLVDPEGKIGSGTVTVTLLEGRNYTLANRNHHTATANVTVDPPARVILSSDESTNSTSTTISLPVKITLGGSNPSINIASSTSTSVSDDSDVLETTITGMLEIIVPNMALNENKTVSNILIILIIFISIFFIIPFFTNRLKNKT